MCNKRERKFEMTIRRAITEATGMPPLEVISGVIGFRGTDGKIHTLIIRQSDAPTDGDDSRVLIEWGKISGAVIASYNAFNTGLLGSLTEEARAKVITEMRAADMKINKTKEA